MTEIEDLRKEILILRGQVNAVNILTTSILEKLIKRNLLDKEDVDEIVAKIQGLIKDSKPENPDAGEN